MHIRRIEAGILNAGSDFDHTMTPFEAGFERFVDLDAGDFIGRSALVDAARESRLIGVRCNDPVEPLIGGTVTKDGEVIGKITAGAVSPHLGCGTGIVRLTNTGPSAGTNVHVTALDGSLVEAELASLPLYDEAAEIPRGKKVDVPTRS